MECYIDCDFSENFLGNLGSFAFLESFTVFERGEEKECFIQFALKSF